MKHTLARLAVVPLLAIGCASHPPAPKQAKPPPSYREQLLARPVPPWVLRAERESFAYMQSRCADNAPVADQSDAHRIRFSGDYDACLARQERAVELAWKPHVERALAECGRTGVECCIRQVSSDASTNAHRTDGCNAACTTALGHRPSHRAACKQSMVEEPPARDPAEDTPAVQAVVTRCKQSVEDVRDCGALPTYLEKSFCQRQCARHHEYQYYLGRVDACVQEAIATRKPPHCTLDRTMDNVGFDAADCNKQCLDDVRAQLIVAPAAP